MQPKNQYAPEPIYTGYLQRKDQIQHDQAVHQNKKFFLVTLTCGIYLISVIPSLTYEKKSRNVNQEILWRIAGIDETARNVQNRPISTLQTNDIL